MKIELKKVRQLSLLAAGVFAGLLNQAGAQIRGAGQEATILSAKQGTVIELPGFLTEKMPLINYEKVVLPGPQYIISDDPEYIREPEAVALKEAVMPGAVRLYVYNVNGIKEPEEIDRKITAVIKNTGSSDMHIRMLKYSSQKPSSNYFQIGKQGLADYFASKGESVIRTVKPGQVIAIDEKLEKNIVKYNELVHGFYEFVIDQPAEVAVVQTAPSTPGPEAFKKLKTVISSRHSNAGRGLFGVSNYQVFTEGVFDTKNGVAQVMLADGKNDPWVEGRDASTGKRAKLAGNYGVMYNIEMKWKSTDGKGLALLTWNSRSADNKWCNGMAASMVVSQGKFKEGIVKLPSDRLITKGAPEAILIQVFPPAGNGEEQTIRLTYSPPGASCLPTPLIFVPVDIK
ncbi:copper amine oxidase [Pararcticibacter amylolyticus]|uniref:Copper amine oxidase n=1 Tax=Pararcticibacter amylolyticus TaxID=2173175 RepID=A0A2U2PK36_9SPHI|nr:copper amine oxidase [Pararcticibacter amylolyticus]PWG81767.1 copper amine oxidase [Pararcticibacter amylolyticus]